MKPVKADVITVVVSPGTERCLAAAFCIPIPNELSPMRR